MKKLFTTLLLACLSGMLWANGVEIDSIYYLLNDDSLTAGVTYMGEDPYYNTYSGDIVIPETVNYNGRTYTVTSIEEEAFEYCLNLTSVKLPAGVKTIGDDAFFCCYYLTEVTLSDSLTSIGGSAFKDCSQLTSITIPAPVTMIGYAAFSSCKQLTEITCLAMTPPECDGNFCFNYVSTTIPLYVPAGTYEAYRAAHAWKDFRYIREISDEESDIETINCTGAEGKFFHDGQVLIRKDGQVYDLRGQIVAQSEE